MLSFLLPLIQQNVLQVTSTWTIKPKLGFRIVVLSKEETVHYQHEDIKPLMALLHQTQIEGLIGETTRTDFTQILETKFPSLFFVRSGVTIHSLVAGAIAHLNASL